MQEQITAYATVSAMADEVQRRTGLAPYAKAVRNLGQPVEIESQSRWVGWVIAFAGAVLVVFSFGWRGLRASGL